MRTTDVIVGLFAGASLVLISVGVGLGHNWRYLTGGSAAGLVAVIGLLSKLGGSKHRERDENRPGKLTRFTDGFVGLLAGSALTLACIGLGRGHDWRYLVGASFATAAVAVSVAVKIGYCVSSCMSEREKEKANQLRDRNLLDGVPPVVGGSVSGVARATAGGGGWDPMTGQPGNAHPSAAQQPA